MEKKVFVVYSGNQWLEYNSKEIIGIYTSQNKAIDEIIANRCKKEDDEDVDELRYELERYGQTQGRRVNYMIEEMELDEWLD